MAGGSGSRLWPLSRAAYPKQFLPIYDDKTMLQSTIRRLANLPIEATITICNEEHRFVAAEQLRESGYSGSIILEPLGKNTAPAVALAALLSQEEDPLLLVLAADHVIANDDVFTESVEQAIPLAEAGKLVTFGIVPTEAHVGYGYIEAGEALENGFKVESFVEKPELHDAKSYLELENYYWNSGIFLFKASKYLEELRLYRPEIVKVCSEAVDRAETDADFCRVPRSVFFDCPNESIDVAVFENTTESVVVPVDCGWNDMGSWTSLWDVSAKDADGNATTGDVIVEAAQNTYIRAEDKLIAAVGVDNLVIVSTKDAVLVAEKGQVHRIKDVVDSLKRAERIEWSAHREVHRPWGKFESIDAGCRYQVKRITVNPGASLSVQKHRFRAEHWVVVSGVAKVTNANDVFLLSENQSTYIPVGVVHALENPGKDPLEIVEIQTGSYLGEDDIIRLKDLYGRVEN